MLVYALRGAITAEQNDPDEILLKTRKLLLAIIEKNKLRFDSIISIIFTATKDLNAVYPAVAARELGMTEISLICCQEMDVENGLAGCIRLLMHVQSNHEFEPHHVYLERAVQLRPDLVMGGSRMEG